MCSSDLDEPDEPHDARLAVFDLHVLALANQASRIDDGEVPPRQPAGDGQRSEEQVHSREGPQDSDSHADELVLETGGEENVTGRERKTQSEKVITTEKDKSDLKKYIN